MTTASTAWQPYTDAFAAAAHVAAYDGQPEDLALPLADSLDDAIGASMALITDHVYARGWEPISYEQGDGFRVWHYRKMK